MNSYQKTLWNSYWALLDKYATTEPVYNSDKYTRNFQLE